MAARRLQHVFALSFTASVLVHAALLVTVQSAIVSAQHDRTVHAELVVMIAPPDVALGLDAPNPPSPTWLGFDEFQEQIAPPAEVEQAAFSDEEPAVEQAPAEVTPDQVQPIDEKAIEQSPRAEIAKATIETAIRELKRIVEDLMASAAEDAALAMQNEQSSNHEKVVAATPQMVATAASNGAPAANADKESTASSTIDVPPENWRLGKPLASEGLELKTRRPELTILTMMTAMPSDPLLEISFQNDGVPRSVQIKQSSGDRRIDEAFIACLYRWRAAGQRLKALADGQTITVSLRLILSRRNAA